MRKSVLDKVGLLDETFFMYGEDIDLSYRIIQAGYKNYYLADTRIIHYKGESTKRGSLNYVRIFYQAMLIFARKHLLNSKGSALYILFIQFAIYLRAFVTVLLNALKFLIKPMADGLLMFLVMFLVKMAWQLTVKKDEHTVYPPIYLEVIVPAYIIVWLSSITAVGGYRKYASFNKLMQGIGIGSLIILAFYGLLNNDWRFSRGMILVGAALSVVVIAFSRLITYKYKYGKWVLTPVWRKRAIIAGNIEEAERVASMLALWKVPVDLIGIVLVDDGLHPLKLGRLQAMDEICKVHKPDEIIFCARDISTISIIEWMGRIGHMVDFKIAPEDGEVLIGSNSKYTQGELYRIDISASKNKR
jgi:hypothetical protein